MVRFELLLIVGAIMTLTMSFNPVLASNAAGEICTPDERRMGTCPESPDTGGVTNGGGVDLTADTTTNSGGKGDSNRAQPGRSGAGTSTAPKECAHGDPAKPGVTTIPCGNGSFLPLARNGVAAAPCAGCSPATIVRVSDLQNFPAYAAPAGMEPGGWAIVGLAANFWTSASAQISEGLLLGESAQVMFTPIGYRWNYGDGSTSASADGGASWKDLGLAEFSATDTSHVYKAKGTFTVVLTVDYRADYTFGDQDWRPVEGIVTVTSAPFTVVAARESTVLVAEDCRANPRGPGC